MKGLKPHRFAELLPMMNEGERRALKADLSQNGQQDEIELFEGQILDGRNRYELLIELGIVPKFKDFKGDASSALAHVKSRMMHRNLEAPRLACVAIGFADVFERQAADRKKANGGDRKSDSKKVYSPIIKPERAMDSLGETFGVNPTYLYRAKKLRDSSPMLFRQVFEGRKPLAVAFREISRRQKKQKLLAIARTSIVAAGDSWKVITGDCLKELPKLPRKKARLIFADPPYNIGIDYGRGAKADRLDPIEYLRWCGEWIDQCGELLTTDGSMFVMINARWQDDIGALMKTSFGRRGFRNTIVWHETFGTYTPGNFTECWRAIHYYVADATNFIWNGDQIHIESDRKKKYNDARANPSGKVPSNVWTEFPRLVDNSAERMPDFPTQIPQALVERIVLACSEPGDLIVDPFAGSGTTGRAAVKHGRRFIGIEECERNATFARASIVKAQRSADANL